MLHKMVYAVLTIFNTATLSTEAVEMTGVRFLLKITQICTLKEKVFKK